MKIIGLTGGISTGKSTVVQMFQEHAVPVIDSDQIARYVVRPGTSAHKKIISTFGKEILSEDGEIDRKKLAKQVFSDPISRRKINSITHLPIAIEMLKQLLVHFLRGTKVVLLDAPLLYETGLNRITSKVIVVYAPTETQKQRLMKRDQISGEEANDKINSQMSVAAKRDKADFVIDNSHSITETKQQVDTLYQQQISPILSESRLSWLVPSPKRPLSSVLVLSAVIFVVYHFWR